jgi:type I restriction enzyme, R subunit
LVIIGEVALEEVIHLRVYVNNVIKGKLLESRELVVQANNNTKAQFANSPTLSREIMNAVMDGLAAHT